MWVELAANFAGVAAPDDSRNDIVVRGNSPTALLWRLEGIPIPSPNHFSTLGTTGGPVSALNPNMIKNSDFITSAFPAEYGNAIGGVFDLGFRKGNSDETEYTVQAGAFTGVEAMAEGPLGKNNGSFLVAGRYSLVGLLGAGGAGGTSAVPNYSDVSYKVDFGKSKLGNFSLFGIVGFSNIDFLGDEVDETDLFAAEDANAYADSRFWVAGLKHNLMIGDKSYLKTIVAHSGGGNDFNEDRFIDKGTTQERLLPYTIVDDLETRLTLSSTFNTKISSKLTLRTGTLFENVRIQSSVQDRDEQPDLNGDGDPDLRSFRDTDETIALVQPYAQVRYRLTEKVTLNAGLNGFFSSLNEQFAVGPRASLKYDVGKAQSLSFGYGLHYQNLPLPVLLLNENVGGSLVQTNRNLDFLQSSHYVLGYDVKLGNSWRGKVEVYYQDIQNAGVDAFDSSYSTMTEGADFEFDGSSVSLVNEGTGYNQGIELTLEKFFTKGYYGLLTTSFFESKYKGSDGVERNSPFNNSYVINALAGKEFDLGKAGINKWFVDTRLTTSGGRYVTPIDLDASRAAGFQVEIDELAFTEQNDAYFRWDVKAGVTFNNPEKKRSHQFYLDIQNLTNNENIFARRYNRLTNEINQVNQIGLFPDFGYKFTF